MVNERLREIFISETEWRRPFFLIWIGQAFSLLGSSIVSFALIWWLTTTTDSAVVLTASSLVSMLPGVFLAPFAGAFVDRWNRRLVMIGADGLVALSTLALILLFYSGHIQIWHIYVASFVRGIGATFHWPAMQSSTSLMVPAQYLARVQGVNQSFNGMMSIAGPPLGALLIGLFAIHKILLIDVVTALIAITSLLLVVIPQPDRASQSQRVNAATILRDIQEGLRYVMGWRGAMLLIAIAVLINFVLSPAFVLLPLLVTRTFEGNQWHLGALNSTMALGMVAGGLLLGAWGGFTNRMVTALSGLIGMGVGALLIGVAPATHFVAVIVGMTILGFTNPITNGPLQAILQERIAPEMQGRVFALLGAGANAFSPIAMILAGPMAEWMGLRFWYLLAASACLLMGISARFLPDLMQMESGPLAKTDIGGKPPTKGYLVN